jgi:hypothetical protein
MLAMLLATRGENHASRRKVACPREPSGTQYDVQSIRYIEPATHSGISDEASTPSVARLSQNFRSSQADGSASVLLAATLALFAGGVPAGCGFYLAGASAVWTKTRRI